MWSPVRRSGIELLTLALLFMAGRALGGGNDKRSPKEPMLPPWVPMYPYAPGTGPSGDPADVKATSPPLQRRSPPPPRAPAVPLESETDSPPPPRRRPPPSSPESPEAASPPPRRRPPPPSPEVPDSPEVSPPPPRRRPPPPSPELPDSPELASPPPRRRPPPHSPDVPDWPEEASPPPRRRPPPPSPEVPDSPELASPPPRRRPPPPSPDVPDWPEEASPPPRRRPPPPSPEVPDLPELASPPPRRRPPPPESPDAPIAGSGASPRSPPPRVQRTPSPSDDEAPPPFEEEPPRRRPSPPPRPGLPRAGGSGQLAGGCPDSQATFDQINTYRKWHGAVPMEWSTRLAEDSQRYAEVIASSGNCLNLVHSRQPDAWSAKYGENLYAGASYPTLDKGCKVAIDGWYNEIKLYIWSERPFSDNQDRMVGHFTALIWAGSTSIGCGVAYSKYTFPGFNRAGECKVVACRMQDVGNIRGDMYWYRNVLPKRPGF